MINTTFIAMEPTATAIGSNPIDTGIRVERDGISKSSLAGIAAGAAIGSAFITGVVLFFIIRSRNRSRMRQQSEGGIVGFSPGKLPPPQVQLGSNAETAHPGIQTENSAEGIAQLRSIRDERVQEIFTEPRYEAGSTHRFEAHGDVAPQELPGSKPISNGEKKLE